MENDCNDGGDPVADLVRDEKGNLYGTTYVGGGAAGCQGYGCGTLFKITKSHTESVLHVFGSSPHYLDGVYPAAGLIMDRKGNFFGTASQGGEVYLGTVFKLTPHGEFTVLHSFMGGTDGGTPWGNLTADNTVNLYGTTRSGGTYGEGTIFVVSPAGKETVLHSFGGADDGEKPLAGLIADKAGNLYGTTSLGGSGYGVVFELSAGGGETILYSFSGGTDGANPHGGLIADHHGDLYGTTAEGGTYGSGTIFKIAADGSEAVLHSFGDDDGAYPESGLTRGLNGVYYGTTSNYGPNGGGPVFGLSPNGKLTVLYSFGTEAAHAPTAGVIEDGEGDLYGTTSLGGITGCFDEGCGTVFKLTPTRNSNKTPWTN